MEWKECQIQDVCRLINGRAYSNDEMLEHGKYKIVRVGNLSGGNSTWFYSDLELPEDKYCHNGDLLFAWACTFGPHIWKEDNTIFHYHIWKIVEDKDVVDRRFFYYYLKYATGGFLGALNGSVMVHITKSSMEKMNIRIPKNLEDQRRIASVLSSLDRKIELNNKINADLEEMAQAIFKNWFVDFEPFKDGKFVDSELGMIPEGWKVGSYSEIIESLISGDWGKENPQGNYTHEVACVRGCDFQDINNGVRGKTPQRYILEKNYQAKHLKDKDILVEISGGTATVSTGRTSLVTEELLKKYNHDIVCTNFCKVLRPLSQFSSYVYYSWKYKYDNDIMFGYENGTSGIKNFAIKDFIEKEPVLIPKEQDIVEFQKIIDNLQKQKQIKGTENTTLSLLRDTLLPRLMSGELEVPE